MSLLSREEKKVEYLELIYDLIFVYIIGRNNAILHHLDNGFVTGFTFFTYVICTLAIIQIWNFSTFYINLYGRNSVRDHVFLFINMYLLYHMSVGITANLESSFYRFSTAWMLILINLGIQHLIEKRRHRESPQELQQIDRKALILFGEAALVGVYMIVYAVSGVSVAYIPILFGVIATLLSGRTDLLAPVDFGHLSERAMLYMVFTFGEMIIVISSYFTEELAFNTFYFSLMAFLIVIGLLLSYGVMYNRIIDKEKTTNGTVYMLIHVFLVLALNNISVALEFMRDEEVELFPKTLFLAGSFVLYFIFLFFLGFYAKKRCAFHKGFVALLAASGVLFIALMLAFSGMMYINIALTVVYVFWIFIMLYRKSKKDNTEKAEMKYD